MDDRDDAEALSDEDFLGVEPSPNHEVVYQPPMPLPPPDARTIETEKVKIAPDPERAALAKQTTVKIIARRPPELQVTPPEVRVAYAKRSRHLFIAAMVLLALAGVIGGIYIRKALIGPSLPAVVGSSTSTSTSVSAPPPATALPAPAVVGDASAPPAATESAPRKPPPATTAPRPTNTAPIGPPVF